MNGRTICRSLILGFTVALLTACGAGTAPSLFSGSKLFDLGATSVARGPVRLHRDRRRPWVSPELARSAAPVLFVSDAGTGDVYIYKLPGLKLVATITGFLQPQGECSDNKGDVWITDTAGQTVYELSHRGRLENDLSDSSNPAACAWDATTGNVAVMNLFGAGSTAGAVLVYARGSGSPKLYRNPKQYFYNFGGYDGSGNLFFDGRDGRGAFMLSELPKRARAAHTIKLSGGRIYFPGMVQWDSQTKQLVIGDQSCGNAYASCLYSVKLSKEGGTIDGKTTLENYDGSSVCDLVQGELYGNRVAGSDYAFCGSESSATYFWPYPAGGSAVSYNNTVDSIPVGAAISK